MSEYKIDIEHDGGEALGCAVDNNLRVAKITVNSVAEKYFRLGDIFVSINEKKVHTKKHLKELLKTAHPRLRIVMIRAESNEKLPKPGHGNIPEKVIPVPAELETRFCRRPGYDYLWVEIDRGGGRNRPLGVTLSERGPCVVVSKLKPGSIAEEKLNVLDHIIIVNGLVISHKKEIRDLFTDAVECKLSMVVERGLTDEAKAEFKAKDAHEDHDGKHDIGKRAGKPSKSDDDLMPQFVRSGDHAGTPTTPESPLHGQGKSSQGPAATKGQATKMVEIPNSVDRMLRRRKGYVYFCVEFDLASNKNRILGLTLANRNQRVVVQDLEPGSLAEEKLELFDRIFALNGVVVQDKDAVTSVIERSAKRFTLTVERAMTEEAKKEFRDPKDKVQKSLLFND